MHSIRRADRELPREESCLLLAEAEYGVLSTVGADRLPYGVPISFCMVGDDIYFHCATEGRKLDNLRHNPQVSFCIVGNTRVLPAQFGTEYESAIVSGTAEEAFADEKQRALEGLLKKYCADHIPQGLDYTRNLIDKTKVLKVAITTVTGKARK